LTTIVWRTKGQKSWEHGYYVYEVCVYHHSTLRVEKYYTNDPYAGGYALFIQFAIIYLLQMVSILILISMN